MNRTTITLVGLAAAAGLGSLLASSPAHAGTTATVYASAGVIYTVDHGKTVRLTEDEVNSQPSLSPDGKRIAYVHNNTVWVMRVNGAGKHQVSDRTGTAPAWTPDSTRVTYTATSCTGAPGTFRVGLAGGTTSVPVSPAVCRDQAPPQVGFITDVPGDQPA
ncbi:DPP IV N-terminal domain-containing protein [Dactylosporangium sp. NPDC006015]|uniref:TolB family protein n=1 Tax=Dactylosporangium sp. NPDC006015 TaxID=3154576 RepID=UPI0033A9D142